MNETCAILPIKAFHRAKTRLQPLLSRPQCATVARLMAIDMLEALCSATAVDRVLVVGQDGDQASLARLHGCDYVADDPALDISRNLTRIAREPRQAGAETLLYIPADLVVTGDDITRLLEEAADGITICRAIRDGGTNALVASPPKQLKFSFGAGSSKRHALAARARQQRVRIVDDLPFQRDIDEPEDLLRLYEHAAGSRLVDYLRSAQVGARLASVQPETLAS